MCMHIALRMVLFPFIHFFCFMFSDNFVRKFYIFVKYKILCNVSGSCDEMYNCECIIETPVSRLNYGIARGSTSLKKCVLENSHYNKMFYVYL